MKQPPFFRSVRHAWTGWRDGLSERNARIHLMVALVAVGLAGYFQFDPLRWAILALVCGLVLTAEWLNSAIETTVDLMTTEIHPLARRAKDLAAGGVLWAALAALVAGIALFGPPIWGQIAIPALFPEVASPPGVVSFH